MEPRKFVDFRISSYVALEVDVVAFFDVSRIQSWTHFQIYNRNIYKQASMKIYAVSSK